MEKSTTETVKSEKVKPEKEELCDGEDDGLSQLRDEESLGTIGEDMEDVDDEAVRGILAKDQVEDVRGSSPVEPSDHDVRDVKEIDSGEEDVVSAVMPVDVVAVENREVETPPALSASSDPSLSSGHSAAQGQVVNLSVSLVPRTDRVKEEVVSAVVLVDDVAVESREVETSPVLTASSDPSLSSDPSAAQTQGLPLLEQKFDSQVVNNLSVSLVLRTDRVMEDVVSAVVPVDEAAVENREVETCPALAASSDTSMVEPSLPLDPSSAQDQGLSLPEQKSDSPVINNLPKKEDVVSAVDEVAEENREVETSPALPPSSDPSVVEPSLPSNPSAAKGQGLSLLQKSYDSPVVRNLSVSPLLGTPPRDGYNWRKYGQKQVKSPKGSRSYYRCTYSECCAKKIECCNDSGNMVEIVNKGLHSHEPPRKSSFSPRERSAITPVLQDDTVVATVPSDSVRSTSTKENICQSPTIVERKRTCENDIVEEPEPKRRQKMDSSQGSDSVSKHGKKHKQVVHAAGDVGISGDGYRWRKYGQKMVKGNPNPRNYYRCTSAGCPVRKHIETAVENTRAIVITYKGEHNHDTPVPKKRHETPSSVLSSPTSMSTRLDDQVNLPSSSSQCSEALDVVGG